MIPQRSALSLLVYLTCLGCLSGPARALPPGQSHFSQRSESSAKLTSSFASQQRSPIVAQAPANAPVASPQAGVTPTAQPQGTRIWFYSLLSLALGSALGGGFFYLTRRSGPGAATVPSQASVKVAPRVLRPSQAKSFTTESVKVSAQKLSVEPQRNGHHTTLKDPLGAAPTSSANGQPKSQRSPSSQLGLEDSGDPAADQLALGEANPLPKSTSESNPAPSDLAVGETTRLPKVSIVDELIKDLQNPDRGTRSKAIWELGQRGDSQAVQPLVDLMIDSDSKQRSLILAALSEIGVRTLKPMNRALAISLQDENPEVRKNAIRDLTRIYDLVSQISQLLRHATEDPDTEVQETARWALNQVGRIRTAAGLDAQSLQGSNTQDQLPGA